MDLESIQITSEIFWRSAFVTAFIDGIVTFILVRVIKRERFRQLKWPLACTAAVFWCVFGFILVQTFWDSYYSFFAPGWFREGGILVVTIPIGVVLALLFYWAALRLPGNPIISFCLLAGLESVLEHLWGIYSQKILDIPFLQEASPVSVLAFAFPEYIAYWCIVIIVAVFSQNSWRWWVSIRQKRNNAA